MTLDELVKETLGKQVEIAGSTGAKFQCVDLANKYLRDVLGKPIIEWTNAKDFPSKMKDFNRLENTLDFIPQKGDVAIWDGKVGGGAGHIAVVLEPNTTNYFWSLDQNWSKPLYVTKEKHTFNNILCFMRLKESAINMDSITIDKSTFETLVTKSSRWDEVLKLGYTSAAQIEQEYKSLKSNISTKSDELIIAQNQAEANRKQFNDLLANTAKALGTVQEIAQVNAALAKVSLSLDTLTDLERQYGELQTHSKEQVEELNAEIARLNALLNHTNVLEESTMEELLKEIIKRLAKIIKLS